MKNLKRLLLVILCLVIAMPTFSLVGCSKNVLRVYNCYDYIDETLYDEFEEYYEQKTGKKITIEYTYYDTPEDAYNQLKINPKSCDILCPSDYMIEKMARENMLQKIELAEDGNYNTYVSPYIKKIFNEIAWGEGENLSAYAAGYMWGTLGIVYNPANVTASEMSSWSSLWDSKYEGKFSIKDSVRDTYFVGLAKYFNSELNQAKQDYLQSGDVSAYQSLLKGYFNNTETSTINAVESLLIDLGRKSKGLEVDSGKEDIINNRIDIYVSWSGDAVYAISDAYDNGGFILEYSVPEEGANVWFDGWVIPAQSQKTEEAKEFIEFLSKPENAIRNMDYIGYTTVIAGDTVFDFVKDKYNEENGQISIDLGYYFGDGDYAIKTSSSYGLFATQYPTEDIINRCVAMKYFPTEANNKITEMWINFTTGLN